MKKIKATSAENNECPTVDCSCVAESTVLRYTLSEGNQSSGLMQSMSKLIFDYSDFCCQFPVDTALFYPYKKQTFQNNRERLQKNKFRNLVFDDDVCSQSICAYAQFSSLLSNTKKIPLI